MTEIAENVESAEQLAALEENNPLIAEYAELGQQAAQADYQDMAEYYTKKKQALIEERQTYYEQKKTELAAERGAHQARIDQWRLDNTATYGLPKNAAGWEQMAAAELQNHGITDYYRFLSNQADIAWDREKKNVATNINK